MEKLAQGDWAAAAKLSGMAPTQIRDAAGLSGGPPDFAASEDAALMVACSSGSLCIEPEQIKPSGPTIVVALFPGGLDSAPLSASFRVDSGLVFGMPPFSLDQRLSRCNVLRVEAFPAVQEEQTAASFLPGVEWKGRVDEAKTLFLTWSDNDPGDFGAHGAGTTVELPAIQTEATVYGVEGGFAADFELSEGCGRYTLWTNASDNDPSYLIQALESLRSKSSGG